MARRLVTCSGLFLLVVSNCLGEVGGHLVFTTGQSLAEGQFGGDGGDGYENSFSNPYGILPLYKGSPYPRWIRWWNKNTNQWAAYDIENNSGGVDGLGRTKVYHRPDVFMGPAIIEMCLAHDSELPYLWHYASTDSDKSYLELKKGTPYFDNFVRMLGGPVYRQTEHVINWATQVIGHGERDTALGTDVGTYSAYLKEWRDDFVASAKSVGLEPLRTYLYQTQAHTFYRQSTLGGPGQAQLLAHEELPEAFTLCTLLYPMETADGIHLTKLSYFKLGHYFAKAWFSENILEERWEPLRPKALQIVDADTIAIIFFVLEPPLVFDAVSITHSGNYGFEYGDDGGA